VTDFARLRLAARDRFAIVCGILQTIALPQRRRGGLAARDRFAIAAADFARLRLAARDRFAIAAADFARLRLAARDRFAIACGILQTIALPQRRRACGVGCLTPPSRRRARTRDTPLRRT